MRVARLRQVAEAIAARLRIQSLERRMLVEWQTKALASYLAALSQSEEGAKMLFDNIKNLTLTPDAPQVAVTEREVEPASMARLQTLLGGVIQSG